MATVTQRPLGSVWTRFPSAQRRQAALVDKYEKTYFVEAIYYVTTHERVQASNSQQPRQLHTCQRLLRNTLKKKIIVICKWINIIADWEEPRACWKYHDQVVSSVQLKWVTHSFCHCRLNKLWTKLIHMLLYLKYTRVTLLAFSLSARICTEM